MKKFNFESALLAKGFEYDPLHEVHLMMDTDGPECIHIRECENQVIVCIYDKGHGDTYLHLENTPMSKVEFHAFWQRLPEQFLEDLEAGLGRGAGDLPF